MGVKLAKNKISGFLEYLLSNFKVYAPVEDRVSKFSEVRDVTEIALLSNRTDISLKPIFFPSQEVFFEFKKEDHYAVKDVLCNIDDSKKVIFGARGCDVQSLEILDRYMCGEFEDPYYSKRRRNTIIIGMTCDYPRESCFCTAFGGMVPEKYDLWFTDIGGYYYVDVGSKEGEELVSLEYFEEASWEDEMKKERKIEKVQLEIEKRNRINLCEIKRCSQEIKKKTEDEIWTELAKKCVACGKCNFICPTCHCFDVIDNTNLDGSEGKRIRMWDSCHLYQYAKTSAENFRKERQARVRYRIYDKFVFPVMRYGIYACVGCGRCSDVCPAGINIKDVLRRLIS